MIVVPAELVQTTLGRLGEEGAEWLRRLPELVEEYAARWSLEIGPPLPANYSFVAPADREDGTRAIIKVNLVERENVHEADALRTYAGKGAVLLHEADPQAGVLLLEQCEPGTTLAEAVPDDEEATAIAATVLRRLWRPVEPGHPFERAADRAREWSASILSDFAAMGRPFERKLAEQASGLFAELADSSDESFLLHQDFHHYNVLSAQREAWLAIDPKPIVGERAFDIGAFLRNPGPEILSMPDPKAFTARRIDRFAAELELDRGRITGWALAQAVELGLWSLSVGERQWGEWEIACAELLAALID